MGAAGRHPVAPGSHMPLLCIAAALLLHVVVLRVWSSHAPVFIRSERSTPLSVRVIAPAPIADHVETTQAQPPRPSVEHVRPGAPLAVANAAAPASAAASVTVEAPRGYDVPPVPEDGWNMSFQLVDPSADFDTIAIVEMEVSAQGLIRHWHVVETNASLPATEALLVGVEKTRMLPAVRDGETVDAIVRYELRFLRVPSN